MVENKQSVGGALQNPSLISTTSTGQTSLMSYSTLSSTLPLFPTAHETFDRQQKKRRKKTIGVSDHIHVPDEAKSPQYKNIEAFFITTIGKG